MAKRANATATATTAATPSHTPWLMRTSTLALAGAILLWAAFPPLNLWPLAFVAVVPWLLLMRLPRLSGRLPYLVIYAAAVLHWLLLLQGIRLAHWALYFGWFALSLYVAAYTTATIAVGRALVHRLRLPLMLAAPIAWVGVELFRSRLASGFALGLLGHSQNDWLSLIQIADFSGAYGVGFVVALVGGCVASMLPLPASDAVSSEDVTKANSTKWRFLPLAPAVIVLALCVAYGQYRLRESVPGASAEPVKVALIQGSIDTIFDFDPQRTQQTLTQYGELTADVRRREPQLDLIVWPESMFALAERVIVDPVTPPPDMAMTPAQFRELLVESNKQFEAMLADLALAAQPPQQTAASNSSAPAARPTQLVVGTTSVRFGAGQPEPFNTAMFVDGQGRVVGRYRKMHAVMCGEYLPLGDLFPWLYGLSPMGGGMSLGEKPEAFAVRGLQFAPNICFESTVPHLIRGQLNHLAASGAEPDVLLNITNDGWFWGSSILDLHFRCSQFRAIENRKPLVIAANTGLSASIDGNGRIAEVGPRRATTTIVAEVRPDGRTSLYRRLGDWLPGVCAGLCWIAAVLSVAQRDRRNAV